MAVYSSLLHFPLHSVRFLRALFKCTTQGKGVFNKRSVCDNGLHGKQAYFFAFGKDWDFNV